VLNVLIGSFGLPTPERFGVPSILSDEIWRQSNAVKWCAIENHPPEKGRRSTASGLTRDRLWLLFDATGNQARRASAEVGHHLSSFQC
jgi:hypothetical protein